LRLPVHFALPRKPHSAKSCGNLSDGVKPRRARSTSGTRNGARPDSSPLKEDVLRRAKTGPLLLRHVGPTDLPPVIKQKEYRRAPRHLQQKDREEERITREGEVEETDLKKTNNNDDDVVTAKMEEYPRAPASKE